MHNSLPDETTIENLGEFERLFEPEPQVRAYKSEHLNAEEHFGGEHNKIAALRVVPQYKIAAQRLGGYNDQHIILLTLYSNKSRNS